MEASDQTPKDIIQSIIKTPDYNHAREIYEQNAEVLGCFEARAQALLSVIEKSF